MDVLKAHSVLGLEPGASEKEARQAQRDLAMLYHPDRHQGASETVRQRAELKMKELNEAYDCLRAHFRNPSRPSSTRPAASGPGHRPSTGSAYQQRGRYGRAEPHPCPDFDEPVEHPWEAEYRRRDGGRQPSGPGPAGRTDPLQTTKQNTVWTWLGPLLGAVCVSIGVVLFRVLRRELFRALRRGLRGR